MCLFFSYLEAKQKQEGFTVLDYLMGGVKEMQLLPVAQGRREGIRWQGNAFCECKSCAVRSRHRLAEFCFNYARCSYKSGIHSKAWSKLTVDTVRLIMEDKSKNLNKALLNRV